MNISARSVLGLASNFIGRRTKIRPHATYPIASNVPPVVHRPVLQDCLHEILSVPDRPFRANRCLFLVIRIVSGHQSTSQRTLHTFSFVSTAVAVIGDRAIEALGRVSRLNLCPAAGNISLHQRLLGPSVNKEYLS